MDRSRTHGAQHARLIRRVVVALVVAFALAGSACDISDDPGTDTNDVSEGASTSTSSTEGGDSRRGPPSAESWPEAIPELLHAVEPSLVSVGVVTARGAGAGSGVIVRADGVIVTNAHVVDGAGQVVVILADGTRLDAEVAATDPFTDLALLRVERDGLPAAQLADRYPIVGEPVAAVGNALGFENTVTSGIVSGIQRSIPAAASAGSQALVDLIQTDAAISPGNSGGALIDASGAVIGINVAYLPPQTGAVNLGFAIPSPTVTDVVEELLEDGTAEHPFLGVDLGTLTPQIAERLGVDADSGAVVVTVGEGTPAAAAGLQPQDVIVGAEGQRVDDVAGLLTALRRFDPGDTIELTIQRGGERRMVSVALGRRPTG